MRESSRHGGTQKGSVILISIIVLGIIALVAFIYNFTSRQSKLASRRMFWGETSYFVVDSVVDEIYYKLSKNSQFLQNEILAFPNETRTLDLSKLGIQTTGSLDTSYGLGLEVSNLSALGRAIVIYSGGDELETPEDQVGVLEITVTVKIASGGLEAAISRQVVARKEFRYVRLQGEGLLQEYALFLKEPPPSKTKGGFSSSPTLKIKREPGMPFNLGRIYLGGNEEQVHLISPAERSRADDNYLVQSEINVDNFRYDSQGGEIFLEERKSRMLCDLIWQDPLFTRILQSGGITDRDRKISMTRQFLNIYFDGVSNREVKLNLNEWSANKDDYYFMLVDSEPGEGLPVEGRVRRVYFYAMDSEYSPDGHEVLEAENKTYGYKANHYTSFAGLYSTDPFEKAYYPLFMNLTAESNAQTFRKRFLPYSSLKTYTHLYPQTGGERPFEQFKKFHMVDMGDYQVLSLDGLIGVIDDIAFDKPTVYEGQGVILCTGNITISGSIKPSNQKEDRLMLVTRGRAHSLAKGDIHIDTDQEIHAFLYANQFPGGRPKGNLSTGLQSMNLFGGLVVDTLDINALQENSRIVYNPAYSSPMRRIYFSTGKHYYKIYNKEKNLISAEDGNSAPTPKV